MKVLLWLIGFMSIVWADGVCDTKFSTVENKLINQYSKELIGYKKYNLDTVASSSVCSKEDVHHEVVMLIPYIKKLSDHEGTLSFLIAIIDKKNNRIKESYLDKDAMKASYISYLFEIDTERYKKISNNRPFAIIVEDVLDGPPTASVLKLFIYKRDKLKPILSNLTIETYDEEMADFTMERKATLEKLKGSPSYETLTFKDKYYYGVNPYAISSDVKSSKEFEWSVNLNSITCHYNDAKYTCNRKPVFNLDEVEANTKKGLRYRKIVLLAMLYEEPLAEENINVYNNITSNLRKNKYFDEANFLSKILRKKFPEKGGIESSRLKELNSKLKKDQFTVFNHTFNLETYTNSKFSFSIDYPSEIFVNKYQDEKFLNLLNKEKNVKLFAVGGTLASYVDADSVYMDELALIPNRASRRNEDVEVRYKRQKDNWYVISGYNHTEKSIFYTKGFVYKKEEKNVLIEYTFIYPIKEKETYGKLIKVFNESFVYNDEVM